MSDLIDFSASAPVPIGRHAEPRVLQIVASLVESSNHSVVSQPGLDHRGEDGRLVIDGAPHTIQITGIPQSPPFWREVAQGSASTAVTAGRVAEWLEEAIQDKLRATPPAERSRTIFALDGHEWADRILDPEIVQSLSTRGLNPAQRHGLAGIAIVGMMSSNSTWLPGTIR